MLSPASLGAIARIADRANEILCAYTPGFRPTFNDMTDTAQAPLRTTDPLSVAAPPDSYFVVGGKDGGRRYTRDGEFAIRNGALVTSRGEPVLTVDRGVPVPLRLNAVDVALGRCTDVRIEKAGTVSYSRKAIDPQTGERRDERVAVGRVALARFPAGTQPTRLDPTTFAAPSGVVPHVGLPSDGSFSTLTTEARDRGMLDLDSGLARLNEAYIALSAMSSANHARGSTEKTMMDLVK